ncbi:MAG: Fe-S cluster assembly scaffold SufA [Ancalomicrobiaceae bacterium]|nr:Fe-S cluster assembly scaffold SufA [Ancalomicrobiaceae bacterium]
MGLFSGFKVVSLTDAAANRVKDIIDNSDTPIAGLRLGIEKGGCAGMSYKLDYVRDPDPKDDVVEDRGVKVFIDPKATMFLLGTVMDFEQTKVSSGFVFKNPNEVSACGCGESVELKPVDPEHLAKTPA